MILSIGEILSDVIVHSDGTDERHIGGAPFNLAVGVKRAGSEASFVGAIGNDETGSFLEKASSYYGLDEIELQRVADRNTTKAVVTLKDGERSFRFKRENGADYAINVKSATKLIKRNDVNIVHLGTLMLSLSEGKENFNALVAEAERHGKLLSTDVNLRYDIYPTRDAQHAAVKEVLKHFDIVKLSADELSALTGIDDLDEGYLALQKLLKERCVVIVTEGDKGSSAFVFGQKVSVESEPITPLDSTGAGDAFYGAVLAEINSKIFAKRGTDPLKMETERVKEVVETALKLGNAAGRAATQVFGAL